MRDLSSDVTVVQSIAPIVGNNTTEGTGTGVDLQGYEAAMVVFNFGISGDTLSGSVYVTPSLQESDDNSAWSAVAAADQVGTLTVIDDAAEDPDEMQVSYIGGKRYIRPLVTFTGTHTNGMPISASVVRGRRRHLGGDAV